jgi:hypothetical protein
MRTWSITTSIREAERIPDFLRAAARIEGRIWADSKVQEDMYVNEIALRVRRPTNKNLTEESIRILNGDAEELTYDLARRIFDEKTYKDAPMRGRNDIAPLVDLGLVDVSDKVVITDLGKSLLKNDIEFPELMMNFALKWQVPEPGHSTYKAVNGYGIRPFIGILALIKRVNDLWQKEGKDPVGLKWSEFCVFGPTLINHNQIDIWAESIIEIRKKVSAVSGSEQPSKQAELFERFLGPLLASDENFSADPILQNLRDYGDNSWRYFKQTRFIKLRGAGHYVDISETATVEVDLLIEEELYKPKTFNTFAEYASYIQDLNSFVPPWATPENLSKVKLNLEKIVSEKGGSEPPASGLKISKKFNSVLREDSGITILRNQIAKLNLQNLAAAAQELNFLENCILDYQSLSRNGDIAEAQIKRLNRPTQLEYLSYKTLLSINDLVQIKPNYPIDDEGNPVFTAGGGVADIEVFYRDFNAICEVTMMRDRQQWVAEGQPVQRHLYEFLRRYPEKDALGIFIAPQVHDDTKNTFKQAFFGGYGDVDSLRIIPFDFRMWVDMVGKVAEAREQGIRIKQEQLKNYLESLSPSSSKTETTSQWWSRISGESKILDYIR